VKIASAPFQEIDWSAVEAVVHRGDAGTATWKTKTLGDIRVRLVEYSAGYSADHWCAKGHVVYVLEGELISQQRDGKQTKLTQGMSYVVGDDSDDHRSLTLTGAKLFIVD
jgi:hypothetical protein